MKLKSDSLKNQLIKCKFQSLFELQLNSYTISYTKFLHIFNPIPPTWISEQISTSKKWGCSAEVVWLPIDSFTPGWSNWFLNPERTKTLINFRNFLEQTQWFYFSSHHQSLTISLGLYHRTHQPWIVFNPHSIATTTQCTSPGHDRTCVVSHFAKYGYLTSFCNRSKGVFLHQKTKKATKKWVGVRLKSKARCPWSQCITDFSATVLQLTAHSDQSPLTSAIPYLSSRCRTRNFNQTAVHRSLYNSAAW